MNTIALILVLALVGIIIISKIPGLEHFTRPTVDLLVTTIKVVAATLVSWGLYVFKAVWSAHLTVFAHLTQTADEIDPTLKARKSR